MIWNRLWNCKVKVYNYFVKLYTCALFLQSYSIFSLWNHISKDLSKIIPVHGCVKPPYGDTQGNHVLTISASMFLRCMNFAKKKFKVLECRYLEDERVLLCVLFLKTERLIKWLKIRQIHQFKIISIFMLCFACLMLNHIVNWSMMYLNNLQPNDRTNFLQTGILLFSYIT